VLICCERKVLLAGCWWLVCSERKVLLAGNNVDDALSKNSCSVTMADVTRDGGKLFSKCW
jgi:hypothetical protein